MRMARFQTFWIQMRLNKLLDENGILLYFKFNIHVELIHPPHSCKICGGFQAQRQACERDRDVSLTFLCGRDRSPLPDRVLPE
ncbi:hypothetical protein HanRHA438_Chr02g0087521 [Helianthus annuus]|nr:hypothetical protein HanRHA438_Chr02g0087521 [Helianthus annuus]